MRTFNDYITTNRVDETFQSQTLRDIAEYAKANVSQRFADEITTAASKRKYDKLVFPRGIAWDKIPDDDIIFGVTSDPWFAERPELVNPKWITVWINVKDLATYISCGNKIYQYQLSSSTDYNREKVKGLSSFWTLDGAVLDGVTTASVKKSFLPKGTYTRDCRFLCICINKNTILKYSTADLIKARKESQKGVIYNNNDDFYRETNQKRYQQKLNELSVTNKNLKRYTDIVLNSVNLLKSLQDRAASVDARIKKATQQSVTDFLKMNGITDEDYINLFFGADLNLQMTDGIVDDKRYAQYDLNNIKDNIVWMMNILKDISTIFDAEHADVDTSDKARWLKSNQNDLERLHKRNLEYQTTVSIHLTKIENTLAAQGITESADNLDEGIFGNLGISDDIGAEMIKEFILDKNLKALHEIKDQWAADVSNMGVKTLSNVLSMYVKNSINNTLRQEPRLNSFDFSDKEDLFDRLCKYPFYCYTYIISPETIGEDPVDFKNSFLHIVMTTKSFSSDINVVVTGFKNLRSLDGLIDCPCVNNLFIWDCPKVTSLKGLKTEKLNNLYFFPEAKDGADTLGKTEYRASSIIAPAGVAPKQLFLRYSTKDEYYDKKFKTAIDRSKGKDASVPKLAAKAAPAVNKPTDSELPVLYKVKDLLYADPDHTTVVGSLTANGTVYRWRNGVKTTNHWLNYDYDTQTLFTHPKGTPAYKVEV